MIAGLGLGTHNWMGLRVIVGQGCEALNLSMKGFALWSAAGLDYLRHWAVQHEMFGMGTSSELTNLATVEADSVIIVLQPPNKAPAGTLVSILHPVGRPDSSIFPLAFEPSFAPFVCPLPEETLTTSELTLCSRDSNQFGWDGCWDIRESFLNVIAVSSFALNVTEHDATDKEAKHLGHPAPRKAKLDTDQNVYLESFDDEEASDGSVVLTWAAQKALDREFPWCMIGDADKPAFSEAIAKEWRGWLRWGAIRPAPASELKSIAKSHILPSRVAYRWKPIPLGRKAKAGIVAQGFRGPPSSSPSGS